MSDQPTYTLADGTTATVGDTIYEANRYTVHVKAHVVGRGRSFMVGHIPRKGGGGSADPARCFATRRAAIAQLMKDADGRLEVARKEVASCQRAAKRALSLWAQEFDAEPLSSPSPVPPAPEGRAR